MHAEVLTFVEKMIAARGPFKRVLEIGSRDINGSVRGLFGVADYTGVDIQPGPGVDIVADATKFTGENFDCVVCCEVFEHTPDWPLLVQTAARCLKPKGLFLLTCATGEREPHSAIDEAPPHLGEFYANVAAEALAEELQLYFSQADVQVVRFGLDLQAWAIR